MVDLAASVWRDFVTDGVPSSGTNKPKKSKIRAWGAWLEGFVQAFTSNGGLIYTSLAAMNADLAHGANSSAWVVGDTTVANNGIYRKIGTSGSGSWSRVADLPYAFIRATDVGAGTSNAIVATTSVPLPVNDGATLIALNIFENNTGPATVSFNGGSPLTIKTANANDVQANYLVAGAIVAGYVSGSTFRLITEVGTAADKAAAEAAAAAAAASAAALATAGGFVGSFGKSPAADGVTNDVASLVALEATAEEVIRLKNASYYIGTNYTPTKTLRFSSGTKFLVANGVTVDFSGAQPEIPSATKQHFYLTGTAAISGLNEAFVGWFAGDNRNSGTNSIAALQKWADSVITNGILRWDTGYYTSDGSAYIECSKGQQVIGTGRNSSKLRFSTAITKGFRFGTTSYGSVENFGFERLTPMDPPTSGECILFDNGSSQSRGRVNFVSTDGCYIAVKVNAGWPSISGLLSTDTRKSAIGIVGTNETHVQDCIFAANSSWITLTGVTGTFQSGETVNFTGGSGTILKDGSGNYKAIFTATQPTIGLVLTGATSGATGTLATRVNGHTDGGINIFGRCDASLFDGVEVSGGDYGVFLDAAGTANNQRNLATVFTSCFFDSAVAAAAAVNKSTGTKFVACWFSTFGSANAVFLQDTITTILQDCQWTYVGLRCVLVNTNAIDTKIIGGLMADVNASNTANTPAIHFTAGTTGSVRDVRVGVNLGYGPNNPARGVQVDGGVTGILLNNMDASACTTPIVDNGTGTIITNCPGVKTSNQGASTVAIGASTSVVTHGLGFTPAVSDIFITPNSSLAASSLTTYWVSAVSSTTFTVTTNANAAGAAWSFGWRARIKGA